MLYSVNSQLFIHCITAMSGFNYGQSLNKGLHTTTHQCINIVDPVTLIIL